MLRGGAWGVLRDTYKGSPCNASLSEPRYLRAELVPTESFVSVVYRSISCEDGLVNKGYHHEGFPLGPKAVF